MLKNKIIKPNSKYKNDNISFSSIFFDKDEDGW